MKSLGLFLVYISVTILSIQQTVAQTSWQQMTSGTSSRLWSAAFANDSTVFAVGVDGLMMKSINKGTSWSVVNHGLTTKNLYSIHFATNLVGFAGGLSATVLKTTDGGATWFDISANLPAIITSYAQYSTQEINDFYFLNANTGFAVGYNGIILKTNDGGTSWNFSGSLGAGTYRSVWFVDPTTGFIASHGKKIKKTVNGGENWADWVSEETTFNHFFEIRFFNATTGVAIGDGGVIFRTVDAGESWTRATVTPAASGQLWGLEIVSENVGYASGQSGQIYVTNDAGVSWSKQETNLPTAIYRGMAHSKDSVVIAVGDGGLIMRLNGSPTEPEVETNEHWVHGIESFGVNLSGGEFGGVYPGTIGTHYGYPTNKDLDYFKSKGLTLIRFPFRWERVQYQLNGPLNPLDLGKMKEFVQAAEDRNLPVILDMHNFARRSFDGGSTQTV
ncbi:MAG: YCF48-related protein, partial [Paludibacter sp.]|nr:YCF48-related protein [Paludibacter sp.]